jgi:TonB-dependent SusC/RagA subfamily outer membrane receptor
MYMPDARRPVQWLIIAASVAAAGCASQPAPLALEPTMLPLNVRLTRPVPAPVVREVSAPSRGDVSLAESAHYVFMEQLLMARAPGLEVRSVGQGRFTLFVRGRPALGERREPLVVIDGMQFGENGVDMLAAMTPRDVKRVEVLKDAASTSVYGTRGSNGVVVVTTRRGDY